MTIDETSDDFSRLHRLFTFHLGVAVGLSWMTALYASLYAPWVRNIRPLLDPTGGVLGVLSIMDETARTIEQPDADRLVAAAAELVVILQSRTGLATVPAGREAA